MNFFIFSKIITICPQISLLTLFFLFTAYIDQRTILFKQLKIQGFLVTRWYDRWMEGIHQMLKWIKEGKLKFRETVTEGFENMPKAFIDMMNGKNTGKAVIKA